MVPLFSSGIEAKRERLWRPGMGPSPDLVLSFTNETGAVLEEGAAVVYDGDVYAGEAMVPYSARGVEVKLAYAKDLGVRCKVEPHTKSMLDRVAFGGSGFAEELRHELHQLVTVESDHADEVSVVVELHKQSGQELSPDSATPLEETMSFRRFEVKVPPRGRATLHVITRWFDRRTVAWDQLEERRLADWLSRRFLDDATHRRIAEIVAAFAEARRHLASKADAERQKHAAWAKQGKLTEQLNVLKEGGREGELRLRYVRELEDAQNRVNAYEQDEQRFAAAANDAYARAGALAHALDG